MSAIVALTAQNTIGVTAVHEVPPDFVRAQLEAVFDDIGVDAAKTGMLFSRAGDRDRGRTSSSEHPVPLVVDPVMVASSGARLLRGGRGRDAGRAALSARDGRDAEPGGGRGLAGDGLEARAGRAAARARRAGGDRHRRARREPVDHLFDGDRHVEIPVERHEVAATHGAGCTHSATLAALLARGETLEDAARGAARGGLAGGRATASPSSAPATGPVDVLGLKGAA